MDKKILKKIIVAALLIFVVSVAYWVTLPKNFDDCILKYVSGAETKMAVRALYTSCLEKFPNDEISN